MAEKDARHPRQARRVHEGKDALPSHVHTGGGDGGGTDSESRPRDRVSHDEAPGLPRMRHSPHGGTKGDGEQTSGVTESNTKKKGGRSVRTGLLPRREQTIQSSLTATKEGKIEQLS